MKVWNIPDTSNNVDVPEEVDDDPLILITPSGVSLRDVTLGNVIVTDLDGENWRVMVNPLLKLVCTWKSIVKGMMLRQ